MMSSQFPGNFITEPKERLKSNRGFTPYSMNGGTLVAIAGDDFALVASDTRLVEGFRIHSRECPRLYEMSNKTIFASCMFHGDVLTLKKLLEARMKSYLYEHNKPMSTQAFASMLSALLYTRRFFPYYTSSLAVGIDENGEGHVYSYDVIGSMTKGKFMAYGSAETLLQPLLDSQVGLKNLTDPSKVPPITKERAIEITYDAFVSATERDIQTGDAVQMKIISKDGIEVVEQQLRKD